MTKAYFDNIGLYEYITPIYNEPNLEQTMIEAKINVQKKKDYIIIFPTNHGDLDIKKAEDFLKKLNLCKNTNLEKYIEYCIAISKELS